MARTQPTLNITGDQAGVTIDTSFGRSGLVSTADGRVDKHIRHHYRQSILGVNMFKVPFPKIYERVVKKDCSLGVLGLAYIDGQRVYVSIHDSKLAVLFGSDGISVLASGLGAKVFKRISSALFWQEHVLASAVFWSLLTDATIASAHRGEAKTVSCCFPLFALSW